MVWKKGRSEVYEYGLSDNFYDRTNTLEREEHIKARLDNRNRFYASGNIAEEARRQCKSLGGDLAVILSDEIKWVIDNVLPGW